MIKKPVLQSSDTLAFPSRPIKSEGSWDAFRAQGKHHLEKGRKRIQTDVRKKVTYLSKMVQSTSSTKKEKSEPGLQGVWQSGGTREIWIASDISGPAKLVELSNNFLS